MPPTFGDAALWPTGKAVRRGGFQSHRNDSESHPAGMTPDRCCPLSLALCAGAYWRALEARGLVRRLTGPFALVAAPASTNRWFSTPAPGGTRPDHSPYSYVAGVYGETRRGVKSPAALRHSGPPTVAMASRPWRRSRRWAPSPTGIGRLTQRVRARDRPGPDPGKFRIGDGGPAACQMSTRATRGEIGRPWPTAGARSGACNLPDVNPGDGWRRCGAEPPSRQRNLPDSRRCRWHLSRKSCPWQEPWGCAEKPSVIGRQTEIGYPEACGAPRRGAGSSANRPPRAMR